jgi:hypothetical protein
MIVQSIIFDGNRLRILGRIPIGKSETALAGKLHLNVPLEAD